MGLPDRLLRFFGWSPVTQEGQGRHAGPAIHVIVLDGTMSSLEPGEETNAGILFKLLDEVGHSANLTVHYEAGLQLRRWSDTPGVAVGKGIGRQIRRAYGVLASRYREGDTIILCGYSRGALAVRSVAGMISRVGLVRAQDATVRNIRTAYQHYRAGGGSAEADAFRRKFCHWSVEIDAIGVWDTVASLGLRLPLLWRLTAGNHAFHDLEISRAVRRGFHALALNETRDVYAPVLWTSRPDVEIEQVWFRGNHGDVGGQLGGRHASRPLANIPLVWMLDRLEKVGMPLPEGWRDRFPQDPAAPSIGNWAGWGKVFIFRHRRVFGADPSERLHESVPQDPPHVTAMKAS